MTQRNEMAERAATLLATVFVVVGGALVCGFIITVFADSMTAPILAFAGVAGGVFVIYRLLRDKPRRKTIETSLLSLLRWKQPEDAPYVPRRRPRGHEPVIHEFGTNQPPSAESVRKIRDESTTTWVPSKTAPRSKDDQTCAE